MDTLQSRSSLGERTRSIAFVALTVAIIAVSAWVTVPFGPIPFTLQMFAITFAIVVLSPKESIAAITCYLLMGTIGLPLFSGMRGGLGVIAGVTGGFLWGYLFGVAAASLFLWVVRGHVSARAVRAQQAAEGKGLLCWIKNAGFEVMAGIIFTGISYLCGWAQYMAVAGVGPVEALMVTIAPFVLVDLCKIVAAVVCAQAVLRALPQR